MAQDTTAEFGYRLRQAIEGHPMVPPNPFGRQAWLRDKLQKEAKLDVSVNTVHKWFNGTARPRGDKMREIARVLSVDEIWLALGRRPVRDTIELQQEATSATGAVMLLAGAIQLSGGRVSFPSPGEEGPNLWADFGSGRKPIVVVSGQKRGETISFVVPEPVKDSRIVAVAFRQVESPGDYTGCVNVVDLTDAERQNFGGFSVIQGEIRRNGKIKVAGQRNLLSPVSSLASLTPA